MKQDRIENSYVADKRMIERIRKMSIAERMTITSRLTARFIKRIRREIEAQNCGSSKHDLDLIFVEKLYGKKLADQLKEYVERMNLDERKI